jgi:FMN phosphatase YigB (HAD superfamily)
MMAIEVKWVGIDFGQCLMDPTGLRNQMVIGDVSKEMGQPELVEERIRKYRILREKHGSYGIIKEGHRDEIMAFVFDGLEEAKEIFSKMEQEHLALGKGLEDTLGYLKQQGFHLSVVAELKKTLGPMGTDIVTRFLKQKGLLDYFDEVVTPQGRIGLRDSSIDLKYKGKTKEEGTLYDELIGDLKARGISASEGVMVGDKIQTDILPAKKRGFKTVQFIGYVDMGESGADFRIADFRELKGLLRKKEWP